MNAGPDANQGLPHGPAASTAFELLRVQHVEQQCLPLLSAHRCGPLRLAPADYLQLIGALNHCAITRACCAVVLAVLLPANDATPAPWGPHVA